LLGVAPKEAGVSCRSGDPFTLCIQDLGRATKDFLLPTLSIFGRSSFANRLPVFPSFPSLLLGSFAGEGEGVLSVEARSLSFSVEYRDSTFGRELKLADLGSSSSLRTAGFLYSKELRPLIFEED
jgi:hypothetical protein